MKPARHSRRVPDLRQRAAARRARVTSLLATAPPKRGDDTERLPDHAALWSGLPLPFTPAQAWHLLSPATQAEIGAAVIGMALAEYVAGDMHDEADQFHDDALRGEAMEVGNDLLAGIEQRLWVLFPDLYGPDADHPAWALDAGLAPLADGGRS